jgi:histone deacetylase complex regulatory component SIN3
MLFHGNPYLIEEFNTFLPTSYRINASVDPRDLGLITITTPHGTTASRTGGPFYLLHEGGASEGFFLLVSLIDIPSTNFQ